MRNLVQSAAAGLMAIASGALGVVLHGSLVTVFRFHLQRALAVEDYRPVYTRSGRRNRVRC
jgi:hypothetical protein